MKVCRPFLFSVLRRPPLSSEVEHQPLALAAGAADHHAPVLGLLLLGKDRVAVFRDAGDDALLAGPADPELTGIVEVDAFIEGTRIAPGSLEHLYPEPKSEQSVTEASAT